MTTRKQTASSDELRREYNLRDLRAGVRGKYYDKAIAGTNLVLIEPDLAEAFPHAQAVNDALRVLMNIAANQVRPGTAKAKSANSRPETDRKQIRKRPGRRR
jgi:hypothetical protein